MFDIGFSEIVVIAVVALIVIGPERLPKVARTLGHMFGRLQRYVNDVKADINREMELDELRKLKSEVQAAASEFEQSVTRPRRRSTRGVRSVEPELNEAATPSGLPARRPPTAASRRVARQRRRRWRRRRTAALPGSTGRSASPRQAVAARLRPAPERDASDDRHPRPEAPQETFISHLIELRTRLLRSIIAVVVVLLAAFSRGRRTSTRCSPRR